MDVGSPRWDEPVAGPLRDDVDVEVEDVLPPFRAVRLRDGRRPFVEEMCHTLHHCHPVVRLS
jgi:hypothetical protein